MFKEKAAELGLRRSWLEEVYKIVPGSGPVTPISRTVVFEDRAAFAEGSAFVADDLWTTRYAGWSGPRPKGGTVDAHLVGDRWRVRVSDVDAIAIGCGTLKTEAEAVALVSAFMSTEAPR